jgi:hypothetical protein
VPFRYGAGERRVQHLTITADRTWRFGVFTSPAGKGRWRLRDASDDLPTARAMLAKVPAHYDAMLLGPIGDQAGAPSVLGTR